MIGHETIAALVPHAGAMCLLDRVLAWTPDAISCATVTHRSPDNPMRHAGRLGILCGVEYASQAMALHGALCKGALSGEQGAAPEMGFLASVRAATCHVDRLDDLPGPLEVAVERLHGEAGRVMYGFVLRHEARILLEGRAAVVIGGLFP